jgi:hypothetical protein
MNGGENDRNYYVVDFGYSGSIGVVNYGFWDINCCGFFFETNRIANRRYFIYSRLGYVGYILG